ncbi:MAG TPA: NAD-dependent epimerase/dehydratase [Polyangiaceae bacterium]|nr:NAD-dependent epimerase/dehydratase [Polyangiaceae bacterium]
MSKQRSVMVTGGAGYVGSALVPRLLSQGHRVTVLDWYLYGEDLFEEHRKNPNLREVKGDIRDLKAVERALEGADAVIHLACISNDPSYDLDPALGKSINADAFRPLVQAAKRAKVERFIYASSSSVYGVKADANVTEELPLEPLTDYSKFKALCERILEEERAPGFTTVSVRPSTVCGYAKRLRLDLVVNILTNHAINNRRIRVTGGDQMRPNIHIDDMVDLYLQLLAEAPERIDGEIFNAGSENHTVLEIANIVQRCVGGDVPIEVVPTNDPRSYHVSSEKIRRQLGFEPKRNVERAVLDLKAAFDAGRITDPLSNPLYFNIKRMQETHAQ